MNKYYKVVINGFSVVSPFRVYYRGSNWVHAPVMDVLCPLFVFKKIEDAKDFIIYNGYHSAEILTCECKNARPIKWMGRCPSKCHISHYWKYKHKHDKAHAPTGTWVADAVRII